jgi:hypothetical protein
MIINTKFDIGQQVWVMLRQPVDTHHLMDNIMTPTKTDCRMIQGISRMMWKDDLVDVYHLEKYRGAFRCDYKEDEIFLTEQELIDNENKRN